MLVLLPLSLEVKETLFKSWRSVLGGRREVGATFFLFWILIMDTNTPSRLCGLRAHLPRHARQSINPLFFHPLVCIVVMYIIYLYIFICIYTYVYVYLVRYRTCTYTCIYIHIGITFIQCIFIYITLGTNNVYKNINLGRQTFNYKPFTLGYS